MQGERKAKEKAGNKSINDLCHAAHTAGVFNKIGCGSAIRASSIALTLHYLCKTPLLNARDERLNVIDNLLIQRAIGIGKVLAQHFVDRRRGVGVG